MTGPIRGDTSMDAIIVAVESEARPKAAIIEDKIKRVL